MTTVRALAEPSLRSLPNFASREDLIAHVRQLRPLLAKNAAETDRNRRAAEENILALERAGVFRTTVPRRYDGHQGSLRTQLEVAAAVGEGCGGTAWVTALVNVCGWFTGLFSERAQDEVWGVNPRARISGVFAPSLDARRVDGGLVVSGKWYFSSGCLHADWAVLGVLEHDRNGAMVDHYLALMPMTELSIEDTWYTVGMRGSGSNCVVAKEVFVPDHRLLSITKAVKGDYPTERKEEDVYRAAFMPVSALILVGPQLGMGRAALDYVIEKAPQRSIAYTVFAKQSESTAFQLQVAKAALLIESAHLHAYHAADEVDRAAERNEPLDYKTRARMRAVTALVASQITQAMDILMTAHGAGGFAEASPLQRFWRDSNTAARHAIALQPVADEVYGKALLNIEANITPLV